MYFNDMGLFNTARELKAKLAVLYNYAVPVSLSPLTPLDLKAQGSSGEHLNLLGISNDAAVGVEPHTVLRVVV